MSQAPGWGLGLGLGAPSSMRCEFWLNDSCGGEPVTTEFLGEAAAVVCGATLTLAPPSGATSRPFPGSMALSGSEVEKQAPEEPQPGREQQSWWCLVSFLCFYGFMAQMRPGESFITPYLLGPDKNFTQTQARWARMPVGRARARGLHGCRCWQPPGPCGVVAGLVEGSCPLWASGAEPTASPPLLEPLLPSRGCL